MANMPMSLTTRIAPARKFLVDGEEYNLLGLDHLSDADETEIVALFARHNVLQMQLEVTSNLEKGKEIAERLKKTRIAIICKLTDLPKDVALKLPLPQQVKLFEAVQAEDEEETPDEDSPGEQHDDD